LGIAKERKFSFKPVNQVASSLRRGRIKMFFVSGDKIFTARATAGEIRRASAADPTGKENRALAEGEFKQPPEKRISLQPS